MKTNALHLVTALLAFTSAAHAAETYPTGTIRLIVPAQPGGASDILGRLLAVRMTETFRHQVVVDNRGGAGHVLATEMTARANANGHTLLLASVNHAINPSLVYTSRPGAYWPYRN